MKKKTMLLIVCTLAVALLLSGWYFLYHLDANKSCIMGENTSQKEEGMEEVNVPSTRPFVRVSLQPLGDFTQKETERLQKDLEKHLSGMVDIDMLFEVLPSKPLEDTWKNDAKSRYRADKIINSMAVSANTVGEYMDALCDTYMIDRVKRYDIKGKSVFEQQDKYYFEDLGLRNYLCRDKRSLDIEKVLEGAVYLKLRRSGYDVYVGQLNGKEIDFVARRGDEVIYVQVALQVTGEETYEREFGNLKMIKDNYPKYVVTMDPNVGLIHDSGIVACSARQFLLTH